MGTSFEADRMQKNYLIAAEDQWQKSERDKEKKESPKDGPTYKQPAAALNVYYIRSSSARILRAERERS